MSEEDARKESIDAIAVGSFAVAAISVVFDSCDFTERTVCTHFCASEGGVPTSRTDRTTSSTVTKPVDGALFTTSTSVIGLLPSWTAGTA